jgi:PhnB protein
LEATAAPAPSARELDQEVTAMTDPIPQGYPQVMPYLIVDGAADAIEFYKGMLGVSERMRMPGPDGRIGHAELTLGEAVIMLADENPEMGARGPRSVGGSPVTIHVYVDDVDAAFERATTAGAKSLQEVEDRFYGDRSGQLEDPFGHHWNLATHVEDVSPEEMSKRAAEFMTAG